MRLRLPRFAHVLSTALFIASLALCFGQPIRASAQLTLPTPGEKLPSFEVVAVKPAGPDANGQSWHNSADRVTISNYTLGELVRFAYGMKSTSQVLGGPDWVNKQRLNLDAKIDEGDMNKIKTMLPLERSRFLNLMMQSLLAERFQLKVTAASESRQVYSLTLATNSSLKLTPTALPAQADGKNTDNPKPRTGFSLSVGYGYLKATAMKMSDLADNLSAGSELGERLVIDKTGLNERYDFELNWTPERSGEPPADAPYPGLFTALQEQLGLKLVPGTAPVDVVHVDSAAQPMFD